MKRVEINISEQIQKQMPSVLLKDLQDNESICPNCGGLGLVVANNPYGIRGEWKNGVPMFPYKHQSLTFCPYCFNGIQTLCEYCSKPYPKGLLKCDCEQAKEQRRKDAVKKYKETILDAKEVPESSIETMLYCEENDKYYDSTDDFLEAYDDEEFSTRPEILWVCSKSSISLDAYDIVSTACEELHEDAAENCETKELQDILDNWCKEQTGTATYYPDYHKYVRINWDDYK